MSVERDWEAVLGRCRGTLFHFSYLSSAARGPPGKGKLSKTKNKKRPKKKGVSSTLDKKDFRAFLRSWRKFGELSRIDEILEDAGLAQKDAQDIADICEGVSRQ